MGKQNVLSKTIWVKKKIKSNLIEHESCKFVVVPNEIERERDKD